MVIEIRPNTYYDAFSLNLWISVQENLGRLYIRRIGSRYIVFHYRFEKTFLVALIVCLPGDKELRMKY